MINLKEEQATATLTTTSKSQSSSPSPFEFKKSTTAHVVNLWVKSFRKWLAILDQWKKEACLIDRLIAMSLLGEELGYHQLTRLQQTLRDLIDAEIRSLEIEILEMQQNIDLLQRYVINTDVKIRDIKIKMQQLSGQYGDLKMKVFNEMTHIYPVKIF